MKKILTVVVCLLTGQILFSQNMHVKVPNFTSFTQNEKKVPPLLEKKSSPTAKQHPEYGILPYNAQCSECVELIDKRTGNSRLFIDPKKEGHTYSQQSYFPLHYKKSADDIWKTIDYRLQPDGKNARVYIAANQPVPTKCDLNTKTTTLNENGFQFEFNKNLTMYFFDDNTVYTKPENGNYTNYTAGAEGLQVKNMWSGIDMQQIFGIGKIETNYIIKAPLQLPITKGWLVFEDHFSLPDGYNMVETKDGTELPDGNYRGDYLIKNENGETLIKYARAMYLDAVAYGMYGEYKLIKKGNDYTLQTLVPVDWLNRRENTYPLTIDPTVSGITSYGDFISSGLTNPVPFGFTSDSLGSCPYQMRVAVPGQSQLTNAYVGVEYKLTYNALGVCGSPPIPPPYCTFSQVRQQLINDTCNTSIFLSCNPAQPPYTGVCTTDSLTDLQAHPIFITGTVPNFLSCIAPQCPDYSILFTLKNQDSICGDQCGYLCAEGTMWLMTVEGSRAEGSITTSNGTDSACLGQPTTLTANVQYGVPPYSFLWTVDSGRTFINTDTIPNYTFYPSNSTLVVCYVTCGADSSQLFDIVHVFGPPPYQPLCIVTADTAIAENIVVWEKANKYVTDSFYLYRAVTPDTVYTRIASLPRDSLSEFEDTSSTAGSMSYRYKINLKDICGNFSALSPYHQTIYLQSLGSGNFQWTPYEIEDSAGFVSYYDFYRDSTGNGDWQLLASIPGTQTSVSDTSYALYPNARYKVVVTLNNPCVPSRTFTTITSNIISHLNTSVNVTGGGQMPALLSNPVFNFAEIINIPPSASLILTNSVGQTLQTASNVNYNRIRLDMSAVAAGIYFVIVNAPTQQNTLKLVKY